MYVTSALQRTDMKSVFLQMAMDLLHKKVPRQYILNITGEQTDGSKQRRSKSQPKKIHLILVFIIKIQMLAIGKPRSGDWSEISDKCGPAKLEQGLSASNLLFFQRQFRSDFLELFQDAF